jgi:hypothetical protein
MLKALAELAERFDLDQQTASATLKQSGNPQSLVINPGAAGRQLHIGKSREKIKAVLTTPWLELETEDLLYSRCRPQPAQLDQEQVEAAYARAQQLVGQNLFFSGEQQRVTFSDQELIIFLSFPDGINEELFDEEGLIKLIEQKTSQINRPAQNASFQFHRNEAGQIIVDQFIPDLKGLTVDRSNLKK